MERAETNTSTSTSGSSPDAGSQAGAGSTQGTTGNSSSSASGPSAGAKAESQKFYVDSKAVSEEEWLKAAGENGYDVNYLKTTPNYRPAISTKGHTAPDAK